MSEFVARIKNFVVLVPSEVGGEGVGHTQLDRAHAGKLTTSQFFGGRITRDMTARAAVSRAFCRLEEKLLSDRIYTRQQRPSWQVNILVLVQASNAALQCDGDAGSSLVFRFSCLRSLSKLLHPAASPSSDL